MRNKWYVLGLGLAALLCAALAVRALIGELQLMALIPGALAVGLAIMALRTAKADSFGPTEKPRWGKPRKPGVTQWLQHREDQAGAPPPRKK